MRAGAYGLRLSDAGLLQEPGASLLHKGDPNWVLDMESMKAAEGGDDPFAPSSRPWRQALW